MGHIKEPKGVDLNIGPMPLSDEDRKAVSAIIARYKKTGEVPKPVRKVKTKRPKQSARLKSGKNAPEKKVTTAKKTLRG